jgi:hypothetical protein
MPLPLSLTVVTVFYNRKTCLALAVVLHSY